MKKWIGKTIAEVCAETTQTIPQVEKAVEKAGLFILRTSLNYDERGGAPCAYFDKVTLHPSEWRYK